MPVNLRVSEGVPVLDIDGVRVMLIPSDVEAVEGMSFDDFRDTLREWYDRASGEQREALRCANPREVYDAITAGSTNQDDDDDDDGPPPMQVRPNSFMP